MSPVRSSAAKTPLDINAASESVPKNSRRPRPSVSIACPPGLDSTAPLRIGGGHASIRVRDMEVRNSHEYFKPSRDHTYRVEFLPLWQECFRRSAFGSMFMDLRLHSENDSPS